MSKFFRVLKSENLESVPWAIVEPHRKQAFKNHGQSLEMLNSRGGLGVVELYCVITDQEYKNYNETQALNFILARIQQL